MRASHASIRNFRRLENITFSLEKDHTVFVGPNNSGKTSAASAFRLFFKRGDFTINDFTVACTKIINKFGAEPETSAEILPSIELDVWLSIDPNIEFGRVFSLLPNVAAEIDLVGIGLRFCVKDAIAMRDEYDLTFPLDDKKPRKPLCHFLSLPGVLSKHYLMRYFALDTARGIEAEAEIEPEEGRRLISSLIRFDFIDAQRNIHDQESGRQNRLSAAFSAYYKHNLQKPEENEAANKVIDENNTKLTEHYKDHFKPLLDVIAGLGVPSAHDRELRLVSSLSPEEALRGSTELYYLDAALEHQLPEAYNGLGFKNLVYIAIQISHFHSQWLTTEKNRELCQLIFIEEPEVHLHAQVQQVFVSNIWKILSKVAEDSGEKELVPQLVISTHSSHIVETVEFEKVRYFRRCHTRGCEEGALNASKVLNLKEFRPVVTAREIGPLTKSESEEIIKSQNEIIRFLKKYLKLTHCDLFFSDAAILVEGSVEKLLLPQMIDKCAPNLQKRYLTVLEVGGAFAHRFADLLRFLGIPYIVITDIDTVDIKNARKSCPASTPSSETSNAAIRTYFGKSARSDLVKFNVNDHILEDGTCYVTFQRPTHVEFNHVTSEMHGRTLEEAFVYENLAAFITGGLSLGIEITSLATLEDISAAVYEEVRNNSFKKTEFALNVISSEVDWITPTYIMNGLQWLEAVLEPKLVSRTEPAANLEENCSA